MNLDLHEHNKDDIIVSERYHQEVHHYSGERSFHEYYDINIDTTIHKDNRETPLPQEIAKKTKPSILPVESTRVAPELLEARPNQTEGNNNMEQHQSIPVETFKKELDSIIDRVNQIIVDTNRTLNEDVCKQELCSFTPDPVIPKPKEQSEKQAPSNAIKAYSSGISFSENPSQDVSISSAFAQDNFRKRQSLDTHAEDPQDKQRKASLATAAPTLDAKHVLHEDNPILINENTKTKLDQGHQIPKAANPILKPACRQASKVIGNKFSGEVLKKNNSSASVELQDDSPVFANSRPSLPKNNEPQVPILSLKTTNLQDAAQNQSSQRLNSRDSKLSNYSASAIKQQPQSLLSSGRKIPCVSPKPHQAPAILVNGSVRASLPSPTPAMTPCFKPANRDNKENYNYSKNNFFGSVLPSSGDKTVPTFHQAHMPLLNDVHEGSHSAKSNPKTVKAVSPKPSITPAESQERTHLAVDGPLFEMKLEEICSRLKFIVKKPFACAKVMLHLLREVLLSDSKTVHVLCSKGADIAVALSRLQSCVQRSEAIAKEIHSEDPCSVQITNALITSMKEASKELLDSIRAAGYNTLDSRSKHSSEMSKDGSKIDQYQSSLNHHKKSVVKTITTHPKEEEKIVHKVQIQSHLKQVPIIENFPQFPKQAHSLPKNINQHNAESTSRQFADYSDVEKAAHLICDHKLSFRVCSMTKLRKQIFLGFEDGAISMVTLSPTYNINLDKCIRYSTEPVTQMICIDLQDKRNGEYLITASGMRDPVIVVWDIATFKPIAELKGHSQFITCLQRVGEGFFASCSFDKSIRVWDCQSWHCVNSLYFHEAPIISCCYSPELNLLATGDLSGAVNVSSPTIEEGKFRSCATYTKFKGCGPILELCFDSHRRLVSFENSKMRVYDCRGTLFKELKCPFFVSTVRFVDHNNILLVDMTGRPNWIDYEQALCDTTLPRPLLSSHQDDIELASKTISQRVTGGLPKAQFVKSGDSLMVYSLCPDGHTLRIHGLN
jgi:WD40 repeat protein